MWLFDTTNFPARWICGNWSDFEGWAHIVSDVTIFLAYFAIPVSILYSLTLKDLGRLKGLAFLFAGFIMFCGITHLIEAMIFWYPVYRLSGLFKIITAIVSVATTINLFFILRNLPNWISGLEVAKGFQENMFARSTIGLAHVALDASLIRVNQALCEIWERSEDEILDDNFSWKDITDERDLAKDEALLAKLHKKLIPSYTLTKRYLMPDDRRKYCEIQVYRVEDYNGDILHYVATVQEIGVDPKLHKILVRIDKSLEELGNENQE